MKKIALFCLSLGFLLPSLLVYRVPFILKGLKNTDLSTVFLAGPRFDLATSTKEKF